MPGSDDVVAEFALSLPMGVNAYISRFYLSSDAPCRVLKNIGNLCMCEILYHKESSCEIAVSIDGPVVKDIDVPNRSIGFDLQK